MADDRDLVFVSYSHRDAGWAEALRVLLEPALESTGTRLWVDTANLRAGDRWYNEIDRAVTRSRVAVVLVSKDYLASEFIRRYELPALLERGVRLAPVLVGGCLWERVPALAGVQWLHDPAEDNALSLYAGGERDRRLTRIGARLLETLPGTAAPPSPLTPSAVPPAAAPVPAGDRPGPLDGVPELPTPYIERDDVLAGLVAALAERDAVGVIGAGMGLHGQGGIGKSVLAAAVARADTVRARFPDGVHWVTVGERADVLAVQLDLVRRLGGPGAATPRTPEAARAALSGLFRDRRALLVVDDVWTTHAAAAFRVTGPRGRLLFTTREPRLLDDVGAQRHPVDVLSARDAARLAARVLDVQPERLPEAATASLAEVGHVALAVALLAAAVRGGADWDQVSDSLRAGTDVYGDHPYANAFAAMQVALARLPDGLAERLTGLAVFPPDETVPVRAVARLWAARHDDEPHDVHRILAELADSALLTLVDDGVALHDLQHSYAALHGGDPALAHAALLSGYRAILPPDGSWSGLPAGEPYVWDHLVRHLRGAGEWRALVATVTDPVFLVRRIDTAGTHAAEADLARAGRALPDHPLVRWWRDWIARHAALLDSARVSPGSGCAVAPTVLAWLEADRDRPAAIEPDRVDAVLPAVRLSRRWGLVAPTAALVRTLTGHSGPVRHLAWSPDGSRLASVGDDNRLLLVSADGTTAETVQALPGRVIVTDLAWSPDGSRIAVTDGGRLCCWDLRSGVRVLDRELEGGAMALAWSPDGRTIATIGFDHALRLRDSGTATVVTVVPVDRPRRLAWSPDGRMLGVVLTVPDPADGRADGAVRLFDPAGQDITPPALRDSLTEPAQKRGVSYVTWSPDGTWLLVSWSGSALLWDRAAGSARPVPPALGWSSVPSWSPDGSRIALTVGFERLTLMDPARRGRTTELGDDRASAVAWSPDGTRIAAAGDDGRIRFWDPDASSLPVLATRGHGHVRRLQWAPGGTALAVQRELTLDVHEPRSGTVVASAPCRRGDWAPDGTMLALADVTGVVLWNSRTDERRRIPVPSRYGARSVAWSADAAQLAVQGDDHSVFLVDPHADTASTVRLTGWSHGADPIMVWSPAGHRLALGTADEVQVREPGDGRVSRVPIEGFAVLEGLVWSPGGDRLAIHGNARIHLWEADGRHDAVRRMEDRARTTPVWSPDGSRLAYVSNSGTCVVGVNDRRGTPLPGSDRHEVDAVAWSPDGRRLVTGGADGMLQVWDDDGTGFTPSAHLTIGAVEHLEWSPAGLAVGGPWGAAVLDLHDAREGTTPNPPTTELS